MWFLSPLFWLGIAAVAAPILVHLVRRTRARKIEFPALTFVRLGVLHIQKLKLLP